MNFSTGVKFNKNVTKQFKTGSAFEMPPLGVLDRLRSGWSKRAAFCILEFHNEMQPCLPGSWSVP